MGLNASTLLLIIGRTQLRDYQPPWLLLPFVLQTGLSHCVFCSGQNTTLLNRQKDSWSGLLFVCDWVVVLGIGFVYEHVCLCVCAVGEWRSGHLFTELGSNGAFCCVVEQSDLFQKHFYTVKTYYVFFPQCDTFCYCFSLTDQKPETGCPKMFDHVRGESIQFDFCKHKG